MLICLYMWFWLWLSVQWNRSGISWADAVTCMSICFWLYLPCFFFASSAARQGGEDSEGEG